MYKQQIIILFEQWYNAAEVNLDDYSLISVYRLHTLSTFRLEIDNLQQPQLPFYDILELSGYLNLNLFTCFHCLPHFKPQEPLATKTMTLSLV